MTIELKATGRVVEVGADGVEGTKVLVCIDGGGVAFMPATPEQARMAGLKLYQDCTITIMLSPMPRMDLELEEKEAKP